MEPLLVALSGLVDRVRGSGVVHFGIGKATDQILYGWLYAALLGFPMTIYTPAIIAAFVLGCSFGWANPTGGALRKDWESMNPENFHGARGNQYEWWQVGPLRVNPYMALTVRGILWGLPVSAALWFAAPELVFVPVIAYGVSMPLAVALAAHTPHWYGENTWEAQEFYRGIMAASITVLWQQPILWGQ